MSFAQDTFSVFYQKEKYFTGNKVKVLKAKFENKNENIMKYFTASFQKVLTSFTWGAGSTIETIGETEVKLPTKNNKIDFDFMETFITEIEKEQISQVYVYLEASGLKDYNLTAEEEKVLEYFEKGKIKFCEFKIDTQFKVDTYKKRFDANKVEILENGKFPYVVRQGSNNGQRGYINEDEQFLNDENTISFGQDTATMFYQEKPYFTGDKIKIMKPKDSKFNKKNAMFFISTMRKSFSSFSWGGSSFNVNIINNQPMNLPIKNNKPDYDIMELFISAIQKQIIKDVVLYTNNKLIVAK